MELSLNGEVRGWTWHWHCHQMKYVPIKFPKKVLFIGSICFIGLLLRFTSHSQSEHYPTLLAQVSLLDSLDQTEQKDLIIRKYTIIFCMGHQTIPRASGLLCYSEIK